MAKKGKKTQPQAKAKPQDKAKPENIEVEIEAPKSKFQQAKDYVKKAPGKAYDAAADMLEKLHKKGEKDLEESKDLPSTAQAQLELMTAGILAMGAKGAKGAYNGAKWVYNKVKSKPVGNIKLESESTSKQEKQPTRAQIAKKAVSKKLTRKSAPGASGSVAGRKLARAQKGAESKLAKAKPAASSSKAAKKNVVAKKKAGAKPAAPAAKAGAKPGAAAPAAASPKAATSTAPAASNQAKTSTSATSSNAAVLKKAVSTSGPKTKGENFAINATASVKAKDVKTKTAANMSQASTPKRFTARRLGS